MRNLKRALSLGLTAAMISGLMVMGSSAAGSTYADVADTDNVEAIEVLKAVGIMVGDDQGNFNPDATVSRNEMAVVMSNLMAYNVATYRDTSPFTDVPEWAEPYVAACYTNGITAGYDATTYGGSDAVTTAQAALMVMKALGYFQYQSDFGGDWQLSTVAQGNRIDLFTDVDSAVKDSMTRNDLAQLVLNALEAGTVEADAGTSIVVEGITITSDVKYNYITSGEKYARAINTNLQTAIDQTNTDGSIVQLGEKLYQGDLTKEESEDDFGRPANIWEYQAKEIGTFSDDADHIFTAKVTSKALYDAVGRTAAENYAMKVYFNGDLVDEYGKGDLSRNKSDDDVDFVYKETGDAKLTGNGVITEVFVDGVDEVVNVAIMEQYAAEVLTVDEEDGVITLSDLSGQKKADPSDEFEATGFTEDQIVLYTFANDKIQSVYAAEELSGDVSRVRTTTTSGAQEAEGDYFVVDGNTYKYNKTMDSTEKLQTENVNNGVVAYLDAQGYVAYIDESAVTYDYAYVLSMGTDGDQYDATTSKGTTVYARLVLTDGTMVKAETDVKASDYTGTVPATSTQLKEAINMYLNHIVSYSKDKNDVYDLTIRSDEIADADFLKVENGVASFTADNNAAGTAGVRYTANANTVFIVADADPDSFDDYDFTVYTGVKNVPDIDAVKGSTSAVVSTKDYNVKDGQTSTLSRVVYIEDADVSGTGEIIFARADVNPDYVKDSDGGKIYEINIIQNGEARTIEVKEGSTAADRLVDNIDDTKALKLNDDQYLVALKGMTEDSDGIVTSVRLFDAYAPATGDGILTGYAMDKAKDDTVTLLNQKPVSGSDSYTWDEDVVVAQYNNKNNTNKFADSGMSSIKKDANDKYIAVLDGDVIVGICTVYVADEVGGGDEEETVYDGTLPQYASLADVEAALKEGNVVIEGTWLPDGKKLGEEQTDTLDIPANTTLKIEGDFDASNGVISAYSTSNLVVEGSFATPNTSTINYNVEAEKVSTAAGVESITGDMTITQKLYIRSDITLDGNITVGDDAGKGEVDSKSNNTIKINGTMTVNGDMKTGAIVLSTNSLYVTGTMSGDLVVGSSDGKTAGYAEIGTMSADVTVYAGSLEVTGDMTGDVTASGDSTVNIEGALEGTLTVEDDATVATGETEISKEDVKVATLNDTREEGKVEADKLVYKYNVAGTKSSTAEEGKITTTYDLTLTAMDLVKHQNAQNNMGYWAGIMVQAAEGDEYDWGWGSYSGTFSKDGALESTEANQGYEGFYRNFGANDAKDSFYVVIQDSKGNTNIYNVTCDVTLVESESTAEG